MKIPFDTTIAFHWLKFGPTKNVKKKSRFRNRNRLVYFYWSDIYPSKAAAPPTISKISLVIAA